MTSIQPDKLNWVLDTLLIVTDTQHKVIASAWDFAVNAHGSQVRKYSNLPYVTHCDEVAAIVASTMTQYIPNVLHRHGLHTICAALLHDTIEDTDATEHEIADILGWTTAALVLQVTDVSKPSDGNRAKRKAMDREHLSKAGADGKTLKLADLISNTSSITAADPAFAKVYMAEKAALLPVLVEGSPLLWHKAKSLCDSWLAKNGAPEHG